VNRAYESRISGLFTDPASWVNSVAQALDYQFGFSVSETWFYRFLQGALLPLVLFQVAVLYLLSALVFIQPYELGVRERFGKPLADNGVLESGMHLKWPWPFETVRRFPAKRLQSFRIGLGGGPPSDLAMPEDDGHGHGAEDRHGDEEHHHDEIVIWAEEHHASPDLFLVASQATVDQGQETVPVNFLNVDIPVEYRINDVVQYAYNHADPAATLQQIANRTFSLEAARRDLFDIMASKKKEIAQSLQAQIQAGADELGLGVEITFVGLQGVHPPSDVVQAFESVIGATEEKEAAILNARAEAGRLVPLAEANAEATLQKADAYNVRRQAESGAETERFLQQLQAYETAPSVFRTRRYLRVLSDSLDGTRKYVVGASPNSEVILFNFEEKLATDAIDFGSVSRKDNSP
jgi:HflK protein